jgi:hypothetical protein
MEVNFELIDPTSVLSPTEPLLSNCTTSSGRSLWGDGDGVHLSAVRDLAAMFSKLASCTSDEVAADED